MSEKLDMFHPKILKDIDNKSDEEIEKILFLFKWYQDSFKFFVSLPYEKMLLIKDQIFKMKAAQPLLSNIAQKETKVLISFDSPFCSCGSGFFKYEKQKQKLIIELLGITMMQQYGFFNEISFEKKVSLFYLFNNEQLREVARCLENKDKELICFFDKLSDELKINFLCYFNKEQIKYLCKNFDKKNRNDELFSILLKLPYKNKLEIFYLIQTKRQLKLLRNILCKNVEISTFISLLVDVWKITIKTLDENNDNETICKIFNKLSSEPQKEFFIKLLNHEQKIILVKTLNLGENENENLTIVFGAIYDNEIQFLYNLLKEEYKKIVFTQIMMKNKIRINSGFFNSLHLIEQHFVFLISIDYKCDFEFICLPESLQAFIFLYYLNLSKEGGIKYITDNSTIIFENMVKVKFSDLSVNVQILIYTAFKYTLLFLYKIAHHCFPKDIANNSFKFIEKSEYLQYIIKNIPVDFYSFKKGILKKLIDEGMKKDYFESFENLFGKFGKLKLKNGKFDIEFSPEFKIFGDKNRRNSFKIMPKELLNLPFLVDKNRRSSFKIMTKELLNLLSLNQSSSSFDNFNKNIPPLSKDSEEEKVEMKKKKLK